MEQNKTSRVNALITGGAGGIGTAVAQRLIEEGYRVFLHDLPNANGQQIVSQLADQYGEGCAVFLKGDLSDLPALKAEASRWISDYGNFRVLINNAGVDTLGPVSEVTLEAFMLTQRVNADAAFVLCQALMPGMIALGGGEVVNNMSIILSGNWENRVPYAMSKGALLGLTRSLAREMGPFNIRVNAVSPGAIPTAMERKFWEDSREELDRVILEKQSLKFRATAEDIANAVWFLVSPQSRFITGHELHVNGGWYMG